MQGARDHFFEKGWVRFPANDDTLAWAEHARGQGIKAVADPAHAPWIDCEGTWFIGVDALPNDPQGRLQGGPELAGPALQFIATDLGGIGVLHPAQLSVIYPGYPRPRRGESAAAFGYRRNRDAAHVDGVKMFGDARRRRVEEPHAWVLGVPLNRASADAAPLVVWEGSHEIMRAAFSAAFDGVDPAQWYEVDVTEAYGAARRAVFETCPRITVHAQPGEAYLMHRLCLHGVAPWAEGASAPEGEGRMIAYFRPEMQDWQAHWLADP
ncbi:hypothetical protein MHM88_11700 [Epibacterium sp. MM17-32]|uniref:hypothetical protein n=1 Tax=Epibacterium sp. MM17-32 TaxID=2917734 RepID=UPI001EF721C1|nr:hypothetical protein [Epibacterium sp. MM17-32]MCG7628472.1 hypothetical protein [Epibacterium sp. MM17-32]